MNILTGTVIGQTIEKNRDGENNVRMLQVEITEPNDKQSIEQIAFSGEDNAPVEGDTVAIIEVSESYKIAIGVQDSIDPEVETGERKIYSQDSGGIQAFVYLKNDGQLILNGTGDFAVRYNELKTAFDGLKDDLNSLISSYNAHIHVTTATVLVGAIGIISPTTSTGTPSTADMSGSKIDTIEVPK